MRLLRFSLLAFAACTRAQEAPPAQKAPPAPPPTPAPAPAPGLALPPAPPAPLALDAPGPAAPDASDARFGVRWRTTLSSIPWIEHDASSTPLVIGDEVLISRPDGATDVFDRATGAKRRSDRSDYRWKFEAGGVIVASTPTEVVGLGQDKLTPIWRLPRDTALLPLGAWILEWPKLRLRRPSDAKIMWELAERRENSAISNEILVGDTLYIQLEGPELAAIDIATGKIRWRRPGVLREASARHVAIAPSLSSYEAIRILDPAGRERLKAEGVSRLLLHGDIAYVTTPAALVAIDLSTNTVKWRRAGANAAAVSDAWLYGWADSGPVTVLARDTGAIAGQVPLGRLPWSARLTDEPVIELGEHWLLGLGALAAPAPTALRDARGCFVVQGCHIGVPVIGATVKVAGATAVTDRRGCFSVRARLGLAPVGVTVSGGKMAGQDLKLDNPFPEAVVFDGPPITLGGLYIGGGCHDSRPGSFP